jgi:hypothetical protein
MWLDLKYFCGLLVTMMLVGAVGLIASTGILYVLSICVK